VIPDLSLSDNRKVLKALAPDLDRSSPLETCIRSHIVEGVEHRLNVHVGFVSELSYNSSALLPFVLANRPCAIRQEQQISKREQLSAQTAPPDPPCSLPITLPGPLSPLHATDERSAAGRVRAGVGRSCSHAVTSTPLVSRISHGSQFYKATTPGALGKPLYELRRGLRPSPSLLRPRVAKSKVESAEAKTALRGRRRA
jgi:hypothetical protein